MDLFGPTGELCPLILTPLTAWAVAVLFLAPGTKESVNDKAATVMMEPTLQVLKTAFC